MDDEPKSTIDPKLPYQGPAVSEPILQPALEKLNRASALISSINKDVLNYIDSGPARLELDGRHSTAGFGLKVVRNLPIETMLDVGDAVHHLRSSLDHCIWAIWELDGAERNKQTQFPTSDRSRDHFLSRIRALKPGARDTWHVMEGLECYPNGAGHDIVRLASLDNTQKHRVILPATIDVRISGIMLSLNGEAGNQDIPYKDVRVSFRSSKLVPDVPSHTGMFYESAFIDEFKRRLGFRLPTWRDAQYDVTISLENDPPDLDMRTSLQAMRDKVADIIRELVVMLQRRPGLGRSSIFTMEQAVERLERNKWKR